MDKEQTPVVNKEQPSVTIKEKHPGRVAQGHKLAALMKQRKEELKQNRQSEQQTEQLTEQSKEQKLSNTNLYYGGIGIVLVAGIAVLYCWNQKTTPEKTPTPVPTRPKISDDDFFRMN